MAGSLSFWHVPLPHTHTHLLTHSHPLLYNQGVSGPRQGEQEGKRLPFNLPVLQSATSIPETVEIFSLTWPKTYLKNLQWTMCSGLNTALDIETIEFLCFFFFLLF